MARNRIISPDAQPIRGAVAVRILAPLGVPDLVLLSAGSKAINDENEDENEQRRDFPNRPRGRGRPRFGGEESNRRR